MSELLRLAACFIFGAAVGHCVASVQYRNWAELPWALATVVVSAYALWGPS